MNETTRTLFSYKVLIRRKLHLLEKFVNTLTKINSTMEGVRNIKT